MRLKKVDKTLSHTREEPKKRKKANGFSLKTYSFFVGKVF